MQVLSREMSEMRRNRVRGVLAGVMMATILSIAVVSTIRFSHHPSSVISHFDSSELAVDDPAGLDEDKKLKLFGKIGKHLKKFGGKAKGFVKKAASSPIVGTLAQSNPLASAALGAVNGGGESEEDEMSSLMDEDYDLENDSDEDDTQLLLSLLLSEDRKRGKKGGKKKKRGGIFGGFSKHLKSFAGKAKGLAQKAAGSSVVSGLAQLHPVASAAVGAINGASAEGEEPASGEDALLLLLSDLDDQDLDEDKKHKLFGKIGKHLKKFGGKAKGFVKKAASSPIVGTLAQSNPLASAALGAVNGGGEAQESVEDLTSDDFSLDEDKHKHKLFGKVGKHLKKFAGKAKGFVKKAASSPIVGTLAQSNPLASAALGAVNGGGGEPQESEDDEMDLSEDEWKFLKQIRDKIQKAKDEKKKSD